MAAYDDRFYDTIRGGCQRSAKALAPLVLQRYAYEKADIRAWSNEGAVRTVLTGPSSVVDVGCGEGWWGQAFHDLGCEAHGIDSGSRPQPAPDVTYEHHDLRKPVNLGERYDLAICLEVAEHLPASRAESFVADLVALAPLVVFSAAMPRQGGTGHINCQPPQFWADLFAKHGYGCDGTLRFDVWNHPDVEPWYKSNLLVFGVAIPEAPALHVIHPDLWLTPR